jgi:hypothetical protein
MIAPKTDSTQPAMNDEIISYKVIKLKSEIDISISD